MKTSKGLVRFCSLVLSFLILFSFVPSTHVFATEHDSLSLSASFDADSLPVEEYSKVSYPLETTTSAEQNAPTNPKEDTNTQPSSSPEEKPEFGVSNSGETVSPAANGIDITSDFTDANFLAVVRSKIGKRTGPIYDTDVATVTVLAVDRCNISSLAGIEYFTSLKELDCDYNYLKTLNLNKNTQLVRLWCDVNQLTTLDVTKNTLLEELHCSSNQLTTLDVTKNTLLEELHCSSNQLTTLDVSKNTMLENLGCSENQLTTLDVSKNTRLVDFFCDRNQLTTLDVNNNTILVLLWCEGNQLTTLDVTKNTLLEDLHCSLNQLTTLDVNKNAMLEILNCYSNQLTTLDVSKNTRLVHFSFGDNQLTTLDVTKNTLLEELGCSLNQLTTLDVSKNTMVKYLYCDENQLKTLDITKNTALEELFCDGNQLTKLDISKNTMLMHLDCSSNQLTTLDVNNNARLVQFSFVNNKLTTLDISKNTALSTIFCRDNQLTSLDITKNTALAYLECSNNQLTTLDVRNNNRLFWLYCTNNNFQSESSIIGLNKSITTDFEFHPQNADTPMPPPKTIDTYSMFYLNEEIVNKANDRTTVPMHWEDNYFKESATKYNHGLAKIGMRLSAAAYGPSGDATKEGTNIKSALNLLQFKKDSIQQYDYGNDQNKVGVTFASQQITAGDTRYNLLTIVVRGTPGNIEWIGNFDMGSGDVHAGFSKATDNLFIRLNQYMDAAKSNKWLDNTLETKVFVTGHSRGAAVANLVAKKLTDDRELGGFTLAKENIFAYTFASPRVLFTSTNPDNYNNIFNLVHYEDFVPVLPLKQWEASKTGITLSFPSAEMPNMKKAFQSITGTSFKEYRSEDAVSDFEADLEKMAPARSDFYESSYVLPWLRSASPEDYFALISKVLMKTNSAADLYDLGLSTADFRYGPITRFFSYYGNGIAKFKFNSRLHFSHAPETYISWLDALENNWTDKYYPNLRKSVRIKCPVDVSVYDESGVLVGRVVNNVVDENIENPVKIQLEGAQGDEKHIQLPSFEKFSIILTGTDTGTLEYNVEDINPETQEVYDSTTFSSVTLQNGKSMVSSISETVVPEDLQAEQPHSEIKLYTLEGDNGLKEIDNNGIETPISLVNIFAKAVDDGVVSGAGFFTPGETVSLVAKANLTSEFEGWYENGSLISNENILTFPAAHNSVLEARFLSTYTDISTPTSVTAIPGNRSVTLSWQPPAQGTNMVAGYQVSKDGGINWSDIGLVTSYTITGLENGTSYILCVRAIADNGITGLLETVTATPLEVKFAVKVSGGSGSGEYPEGAVVTITAAEPALGKTFKEWQLSAPVTYIEGTSATTKTASFIMPASAVNATAVYTDLPASEKPNQPNTPPKKEPILTKEIKIKVFSLTLPKKGASGSLKTTILPSNTTSKVVRWKSSNPKTISVDKNGRVKALKSTGKATITVTTTDGSNKSAKIIVYIGTKVSRIKVSQTKANLAPKKSVLLKVTVFPTKAINKRVIWSSSNSKVATVNKNGKVTAVAKGSAIITVQTQDGNKKATCRITVK